MQFIKFCRRFSTYCFEKKNVSSNIIPSPKIPDAFLMNQHDLLRRVASAMLYVGPAAVHYFQGWTQAEPCSSRGCRRRAEPARSEAAGEPVAYGAAAATEVSGRGSDSAIKLRRGASGDPGGEELCQEKMRKLRAVASSQTGPSRTTEQARNGGSARAYCLRLSRFEPLRAWAETKSLTQASQSEVFFFFSFLCKERPF